MFMGRCLLGVSGPRVSAPPLMSPMDRSPEQSVAAEVDEVVRAVVRCVEGMCEASVRSTNVVPLHPVLCQLMQSEQRDALSDSHQRAIDRREPIFEEGDSPSALLLILPFIWDGCSLALMELSFVRDPPARSSALRTLVCGLGALGFQRLIEGHEGEIQTSRLAQQIALTEVLLDCSSVAEVATATVQFWNERAGTSAAVWAMDEGSGRMVLAASVGIDLQELPSAMRILPAWDECLPAEKEGIRGLFPSPRGAEDVSVAAFDRMLLIVAGRDVRERYLLASMRPFLELAIERCGSIDKERQRSRETEAGMACAIHEVRGSLLAARNALEVVRNYGGNLFLLEQSRDELERTSRLAEILLRCCKGFADLDFRPEDLTRIVNEAVDSCLLESGEREVLVTGPSNLSIAAEEHSLRSAIGNVVRNALAYSSEDERVDVSLRLLRDGIEVRTTAPGPHIAEDEQERLFEPFFRGRSRSGSEGGSGLGLFLARRVVEAHGGSIRAFNDNGLTSFAILMPHRDPEEALPARRRPSRRASVLA
jgi:signal transduction histidine kinase